jgi:cytochrome c
MDTMEFNKAVGAVLLAGIGFMVCGLLAGGLVEPTKLEKPAIAIATPEAAAPATAAAPAPQPIAALLASADVKAGDALAHKVCGICHTFDEGGKAGVGPNLYGVLGAPHGHMEGFAYSDALKAKQGPWTYDELNEWLTKPAAYAPGTKMGFAGLPNPKERADVILYLRSLSKTPEALPDVPAAAPAAAAPAAAAPAAAAAAPAGEPITKLIAAANPADGEKLVKKYCGICHTFTKDGKAGVGPNLYGIVGAPHGHMEGFAYSDALKAKQGPWTYDELNEWLTKPATYAPGTKMSFAGISSEKERAAVIAYLRSDADSPAPLPGQ